MTEKTPGFALEVRNLSKQFVIGGAWRPVMLNALTRVSFGIRRGEVVALVGESGSGKSTVARLIARLMQPTEGEILLHGRDVLAEERSKASLAYRRQVQMIFQDPFGSLSPTHTISYHLERPMQIHGLAEGSALKDGVRELLETVGLNPPDEVAARFPFQMSGGQRQRVAIARALAVQPSIILADEPTSMLDVSIRMGVLNLIDKLKSEQGIGFLYITHDLASARYVGDRTMVMYAGHIVEEGESRALMEQPAHPYTQLLLASVPDPNSGFVAGSSAPASRPSVSVSQGARGCPFAARCPSAMVVCREVMPGAIALADNHSVRCHLYTSATPA